MSRSRERHRIANYLLPGIVAVGCVLLGREVIVEADRYLNIDSRGAFLLVPLRWTAIAVGSVASAAGGVVAWRRREVTTARAMSFLLRGLLYGGVLGFVAATVSQALGGAEWNRFPVRSVFFTVLLLGTGLWTLLAATLPIEAFRSRQGSFRVLDAVLVNLVAMLALSEVVLGVHARLRPSQILWDEASVESLVASRRLAPGALHNGFRANSGGFYDREFFEARDEDFVVALISDSFGLGTVHYQYNFATIAEKRLAAVLERPGRRVAVNNFSVTGIDVSGYAWLLENEVLPTKPELVVLVLFVGNDITGFEQYRSRYYSLQYLRIHETVRRLLALRREAATGGRIHELGRSEQELTDPPVPPRPEEEEPTLSEPAFLALEEERLQRCAPERPHTQRKFRGFLEALEFFERRVGAPLLVVLIPDEYQVNDELYGKLMQRVSDPQAYQREYPQQRIGAFCREHGIELLDLLTPMREAQRSERVYHLRDTHWNAGGNRIAGDAIADAILARPEVLRLR